MKRTGHKTRWTHLPTIALAICLSSLASSTASAAVQVEWELLRPTNSGIPGELVRSLAFAPDGKLWVSAYQPTLWNEGGVGIYDFATDVWTGFYDWQSPLPTEHVGDIRFDASGAAWMGTSAGLVRYDGVNWQIFDSSNSPMQLGPVQNVEIATDGTIWLNNSSPSGGGDAIYAFDGVDQWTRYGVPTELPWPDPWQGLADLFIDSQGHVWVTNDVLPGLAEFDGTTWTLHDDPMVAPCESLVEDNAGNLWMIGNQVTGQDFFYKFNGSFFTAYPFPAPTVMAFDPEDGALYCANWHGTILRSTTNGLLWSEWLTGLNIVLNIVPEPGTTDVWVGTAGAVGDFTYDGELVHDYNTWNTGIGDFWIDRMTEDQNGHFWLAAGEAGLSRFDGQRWRNWGEHNAGSEPYPFTGNDAMGTAYQDATGTHWFGGNGIARWNSSTGVFSGFWNRDNNPGLNTGFIHYFAEDKNGDLFAVTKTGVAYKFDGALWQREPVDVYVSISGCGGTQADSQGNAWVAGWFDVYKWDGSAWSQVALPYGDYFFDLGGINRMVIGPDDVMWFATMQGLVRWDGVDFTIYDTSNTPVPALAIRGVDVRDDGLIGISAHDNNASSSGIALVDAATIDDPATWQTFDYGVSPQPHWQIEDCTFDPWGDLWVSALSMGVAILHIDDVVATEEPAATVASDAMRLAVRPNPMRAIGEIAFEVPAGGASVELAVYDARGRRVRSLLRLENADPGRRSVVWDGRNDAGTRMPNGVYFARAQVGRFHETRKLTLLW